MHKVQSILGGKWVPRSYIFGSSKGFSESSILIYIRVLVMGLIADEIIKLLRSDEISNECRTALLVIGCILILVKTIPLLTIHVPILHISNCCSSTPISSFVPTSTKSSLSGYYCVCLLRNLLSCDRLSCVPWVTIVVVVSRSVDCIYTFSPLGYLPYCYY